jgi:hypothetical protein
MHISCIIIPNPFRKKIIIPQQKKALGRGWLGHIWDWRNGFFFHKLETNQLLLYWSAKGNYIRLAIFIGTVSLARTLTKNLIVRTAASGQRRSWRKAPYSQGLYTLRSMDLIDRRDERRREQASTIPRSMASTAGWAVLVGLPWVQWAYVKLTKHYKYGH